MSREGICRNKTKKKSTNQNLSFISILLYLFRYKIFFKTNFSSKETLTKAYKNHSSKLENYKKQNSVGSNLNTHKISSETNQINSSKYQIIKSYSTNTCLDSRSCKAHKYWFNLTNKLSNHISNSKKESNYCLLFYKNILNRYYTQSYILIKSNTRTCVLV